MVRRAVTFSACLSALTVSMVPTASVAASAPPLLRVVGTSAAASQASVVVVVPPELANRALPTSAFGLQQGGRQLPVEVQRVAAAGLDVFVVLDTTPANAALVAQQSAAADLLRQLPANVRTAVATSENAIPAPQPGNVTALRALAAVRPRSAMVVTTTLNRIVGARVDGRRQVVVLMTSCPAAVSADLNPLRAALGSGTSQLNVIGSSQGCRSRLLSLANERGGLTLVAVAANQLAGAVDTVSYDILGQYRLSVPVPTEATPVVASVNFAGVHAATIVQLPTQAASPPPPRPPNSGGSRLHVVLAALAGLILLAVAGVALRLTVRTRGEGGRPRQVMQHSRPIEAAEPAALVEQAKTAQPLTPARAVAQPALSAVPSTKGGDVGLAIFGPQRTPAALTHPVTATAVTAAPGLNPAAALPAPHAGLALPASEVTDGTIRVRLPRDEDARALHGFAASDGGLAGGWVPLPENATEADCAALVESWSRAWGSEQAEEPRDGLGLVVELVSEGGMIGYVGLRAQPDAIEVTFGMAPAYRGQGYAKRALRLVANWLAGHQPARMVQAVILPRDNVSRRVARDVGFVPRDIVRTFVPTTGRVDVSLRFVIERRSSGHDRRVKERRRGVAIWSSGIDRRDQDRRSHGAQDRRRSS